MRHSIPPLERNRLAPRVRTPAATPARARGEPELRASLEALLRARAPTATRAPLRRGHLSISTLHRDSVYPIDRDHPAKSTRDRDRDHPIAFVPRSRAVHRSRCVDRPALISGRTSCFKPEMTQVGSIRPNEIEERTGRAAALLDEAPMTRERMREVRDMQSDRDRRREDRRGLAERFGGSLDVALSPCRRPRSRPTRLRRGSAR
jgi:hypothetical protein